MTHHTSNGLASMSKASIGHALLLPRSSPRLQASMDSITEIERSATSRQPNPFAASVVAMAQQEHAKPCGFAGARRLARLASQAEHRQGQGRGALRWGCHGQAKGTPLSCRAAGSVGRWSGLTQRGFAVPSSIAGKPAATAPLPPPPPRSAESPSQRSPRECAFARTRSPREPAGEQRMRPGARTRIAARAVELVRAARSSAA